MTLVSIVHKTRYDYAGPVTLGRHEFLMSPLRHGGVRVLSSSFHVAPYANLDWSRDTFGNTVATTTFDPGRPSDFLEIVSRFDVLHRPCPVASLRSLSMRGGPEPLDPHDLARPRDADEGGHAAAWALAASAGAVVPFDRLRKLNAAIGKLPYARREEPGVRLPWETICQGGTCKDLANLMIEAARWMGFQARFVSGYIYDPLPGDATGPVRGGGSTHAWGQVMLPGAGWVDFDPTNNGVGARNLVAAAVAPTQWDTLTYGRFSGAPLVSMRAAVETLSCRPSWETSRRPVKPGAPSLPMASPRSVPGAIRSPEALRRPSRSGASGAGEAAAPARHHPMRLPPPSRLPPSPSQPRGLSPL